jgi:hypothetical protein
LDKLKLAVARGNKNRATHFTHKYLGSFAAKVAAVVRSVKLGAENPQMSLSQLRDIADSLNPYQWVGELVRQLDVEKYGNGLRLVLAFGHAGTWTTGRCSRGRSSRSGCYNPRQPQYFGLFGEPWNCSPSAKIAMP